MSLPTIGDEDNKENKDNKDSKESMALPSFEMPSLEDIDYASDKDSSDINDNQSSSVDENNGDIEEDTMLESKDIDVDLDDSQDIVDNGESEDFEPVRIEDTLNYDDNKDEINDDLNKHIEAVDESVLPDINSDTDTDTKENDKGNGQDKSFEKKDDYNPDYESDLEDVKKDKFIDKAKKKIIPLGGKRSKRKIKSSEIDDRTNVVGKTKAFQFAFIVGVVIMFTLGIKNTFFPAHVYTDSEIRQFAREGAGKTEFPGERGQAFVENFMSAYLTFDNSKPELSEAVKYYYGEQDRVGLSEALVNGNRGNEARQQVIIEPKVYEVTLSTDYSAQYKLSAYVTDTSGVGDVSTGRWISFAVNVYYDIEDDSLAITRDSPSVIPPYRIMKTSEVPERMPLGNGEVNDVIAPAMNPTINGFIESFAESSVESHDSVLQYIDDKEDVTLYDGFGGTVELYDEPSESIQSTIYDYEEDLYRVALTVNWLDTVSSRGENEIVYDSKYIMSIKLVGDGKYVVSEFTPYSFYKQ